MDIASNYDLQRIVREFENVFSIDGQDLEEKNIDVVIHNVKERIERGHGIPVTTYKINAPELNMGTYRSAVAIYTENVARIHGKLAGYLQISRFLTSLPVSLSSVNYLGVTKDSLKLVLISLQRKATLPSATEAIESLKDKVGALNICVEKRLFIILLVANAIGLDEVTSAVAELLFLAVVR